MTDDFPAHLLPKGSTSDHPDCSVEVTSVHLKLADRESVLGFFSQEGRRMTAGDPKAEFREEPDLPVGANKTAFLRLIAHTGHRAQEVVGLIPAGQATMWSRLVCASPESFVAAFSDYKHLLSTYHFLASEVSVGAAIASDGARWQAITSADDQLNAGLVRWRGRAFSVAAPDGWLLDNESGSADGLIVTSYVRGEHYESADALLYVNFADKAVEGNATLDEVIRTDYAQLKRSAPSLKMVSVEVLPVGDGSPVKVMEFTGNQEACCELTAYVDEGDCIAFLTLSAKTESAYRSSKAVFVKWLASFKKLAPASGIEK